MDLSSLSSLPIVAVLSELRAALAEASNVVLEAPPGAGKSTGVPLALLDAPWLGRRRIVMLQPRRLAARAVARRLARLAGDPEPGGLVGYRTRLDTRVGPATRIEVVTEGILTRRLQADPALEDTGLVVFDEFHERSLQSDLGLALAVDAQRHLRGDLRLLVMSATLQGIDLANALGADLRTVRAPGRAYSVETHYATAGAARAAAQRGDTGLEQRATNTLVRALEADPGDALVFLPGVAEIRRTCDALASHDPAHLDVQPLYGDLETARQDAALRPVPAGRRKVVVATNIAETSLTIDGVRIVVDAGLERRPRFDPNTGMTRLETVRISRASADQRRGRAGRTAPGTCYRLWTESEHAALAAQAPAEILEADLAPLALELACWGVTDPATLAWIDAPPAAMYTQARALLRALDALDDRGHVSAAGRRMATLGVHPRLAHMLLRAVPLGLERLACEIAAVLAERDPLRALERMRDPDLRHRVDVLRGGAPPPGTGIDRGALQQARRTADLLERRLRSEGRDPGDTRAIAAPLHTDEAAGLLLAFAYPDRIGLARRDDTGRYLLTQGRGATLIGPAALARSEFIVAASIDAGERDARIQLAAPLRRELLEQHFAGSLVERDEVAWDARTESVVARRVRRLGALVLDEQPLTGATTGIERAMLQGVRELGLDSLPWTPELRQWRARVLLLREIDLAASGQTDWPDLSDDHLRATLEDWLLPWLAGITRRSQLVNVALRDALSALLDWGLRQRLDEQAPTHVTVPSGSRIAVDYLQSAPALAVRLQEVFGWLDSPHIANGRLPLTLALLSPARRPVQVTRDLRSFWRQGYAEVRKEMRGRYPKHYWPEDPLTATPTRKVRPPASP